MSQIPLILKKPEILSRLKVLEKAAKKADAATESKHRKDEEHYLECYRNALRKGYEDALKISYIEAKASRNSVSVDVRDNSGKRLNVPYCPRPTADRITDLIRIIENTSQERFVINAGGQYAELYRVLTANLKSKTKSVCD